MSARALSPPSATDLYGAELLRSVVEAPGSRDLRVVDEDGEELPFAIRRYLAVPGAEEQGVLARAVGPVLDIGCGPGRHVLALGHRGVVAVGVDISPLAVRLARTRGARVIEASIFDRLPGAGSWGSALLLDGNIGIGGAPRELLVRVGTLLAPTGFVLVEVEAAEVRTGARRVRLESEQTRSGWFSWARVGAPELQSVAAEAGFEVDEQWRAGGRRFATLRRSLGSGALE